MALGAIFSAHPSRIRWRHIFWGLALQYIFGLIILRWDVGQQTFLCLGDKVSEKGLFNLAARLVGTEIISHIQDLKKLGKENGNLAAEGTS